MTKYALEAVVFLCGAIVMVLEIVGARVLAPYQGTSIYVWTSLIGIILASLSLGYWWGGKLADRNPSYRVLALIIFLAGVFVALLTFSKEILLIFIRNHIADVRLGAAVATITLFSIPSVLLGMVSPYAVRLRIESLDRSGATVGYLYAISTIGSILGTFLAGFVLISYFGNTKILLVLAITLMVISLLAYSQSQVLSKSAVIVLAALSFFAVDRINLYGQVQPAGFVDVDTQYNRVWIFDVEDKILFRSPIKLMMIGDENSSAKFLDNDDLVFEYTKYYRLAEHFVPDINITLMLGGGGYSYPKDFLKRFPTAKIDVVEIDPMLTTLARENFDLQDNDRLRVIHEDGRTFLNSAKTKYDAIFIDVFKSLRTLPYQLTTKEAVQKIHDSLTDKGAVLVNTIASIEGKNDKFLRAEYATYRTVFPQVHLFMVQAPADANRLQNIMLVALKSEALPLFRSADPQLDGYLKHRWTKNVPEDVPVLTDDFAPVDHYLAGIGSG